MLDDQELMLMHIQALFTHDAQSRLLRVNEPGGGGPAPRLFLGRTRAGNLWRFRADLPDRLVHELEALCADEPVDADLSRPPRHAQAYVRLLEADAPVRDTWNGPAYRFTELPEPATPPLAVTETNADLLQGGFEDLAAELADWQPFFARVEAGRAVSVCRSVRITARAHEAGVETLPELRGKGYAKDVVAGWARAVQRLGAMPIYSTSWENSSSRALAKKIGLVPYGADYHIA